MKKVAVFASGSGSNYEAMVTQGIPVDLVVCDRAGAYVLERAKQRGTETLVLNPKAFETKAAYEKEIVHTLQTMSIQFIVLAGYMRLLGPTILQAYMGRIINIHPSLLPAFPGKDAIGQAMQHRVCVTGITIHFVDEGMDTGPIIAQKAIEIDPDDTRESVTQEIQRLEHATYPKVVQAWVNGEIILQEGRVQWRSAKKEH